MTETYKISIGRKDLYSKDYKSVESVDYEKKSRINISRSLVDMLSILIKEER
ncbi:hypothetical protein [Romboutsia lituseburensis]|uniref:hypothetical protein n=1 Tax=Romboutsia lituseburensis TaxID=1537 RepID=UPI0022EB6368|nr:hypothetical protein [Romboutsia lituseburensis]